MTRLVLLAGTAVASGIAAPAFAQVENGAAAPSRYVLDANGVNLATGFWQDSHVAGVIGSGRGALAVRALSGGIEHVGRTLSYSDSGTKWYASVPDANGSHTERFTKSGSTFVSSMGDGAQLSQIAGGAYVLTLSDGTAYTYGYTGKATGDGGTVVARLSQIKTTDGAVTTFTYNSGSYCPNNLDNCGGQPYRNVVRLQSVANSFGYQIHYDYASDTLDRPQQGSLWMQLRSMTLLNNAVDGCDPAASSCSYSRGWPTIAGGFDGGGYTDTAGRHATYGFTLGPPASINITRPGSSSVDTRIFEDSNSHVTSVVTDGRTWTYSFTSSGTTMTATITNPDGTHRTVVSDTNVGLPTSVTDELNHTIGYAYDASGRLSSVTQPEGNQIKYTYDARGNVTQTTYVPKAGSGLANVSTTANYDTTCSNPVKCNQPNWTKDAKGNQTDYTYDPTHGGVLTVTAPAGASGVRPQTRYTYQALQAYYKNGSGSLVASGVTDYEVTAASTCRTNASCAGTADETKTTIAYGTAGTPNNLLPTSSTVAAGDGSVSATTSVGYDALGNAIAVDGPLAGTADTTSYLYDADREVVGQISADPDGAGPLKQRAVRLTYNGDGNVTLTEVGTASGTDATALAGMSVLQSLATSYDASGRKVRDVTSAQGTTFGVSEYSYDAVGRPSCSTVRMNASAWGTATDACTLEATSTFGPDRIGKTFYDAAGHVAQTRSGMGTADEAADASATYTANGKVQTATDANTNTTSYAYDGLDRLSTTTYPGSSYEQLGYDANSNATSRRLRDGNSLTFGYDALNRVTSKHVASKVVDEFDISYAYDLLGHLTQALDANGHVTNLAYDALGRQVSETSNWTTRSWQYDAAGRRTRLTYGTDGFYVSYEYDLLNEMTVIRENGALALATFGYDDLGRRTRLTRGNGTVTSYGYDGASRLTSLGLDLAGTASDLARTFGYNPAGQIASRTNSNDAYTFAISGPPSRSYAINTLNQYTNVGGTALGYDARGNLTSSGTDSYSYTAENRLATAPGGYIMTYDPLGRYHWISTGNPEPWMQYDGSDIIEELTSAGIARRYVFGPGGDEPLVWYEGAGTSDRRYLHADERGSIVAMSDSAGNKLAIDTYDEYGLPGSGNIGRFQYTGQAWIPEAGLYYYKARMYSPRLGRFMQTDPIGYADGMNRYNYVGGDPVNFTDPLGLYCANGESGDTEADCAGKGGHVANSPTVVPTGPDIIVSAPSGGGNYAPPISFGNGSLPTFSGGLIGGSDHRGTLLRRLYRWINPDPCAGRGTNEQGSTSGYEPYDLPPKAVSAGVALSLSKHGPGSASSQFNSYYSNPINLAFGIDQAIQTNPLPQTGRGYRYTVNLGQEVGYDSVNGGNTDYITVTVSVTDGVGTITTAYPGCPKGR